jgi:hypothetical protein
LEYDAKFVLRVSASQLFLIILVAGDRVVDILGQSILGLVRKISNDAENSYAWLDVDCRAGHAVVVLNVVLRFARM